jgi:hypothetical protein
MFWASILTAILGIVSGVMQKKTHLAKVCLVVNAAWLAFPLYAYVMALVLWIHNHFSKGPATLAQIHSYIRELLTSNF